MPTYKIVRHFADSRFRKYTVPGLTGLTREQALAHCNDPETSSKTCAKPHNRRRTRERGDWFDSFTEE